MACISKKSGEQASGLASSSAGPPAGPVLGRDDHQKVPHIMLDVVLHCRRRFMSLRCHVLLVIAMPSLLWPSASCYCSCHPLAITLDAASASTGSPIASCVTAATWPLSHSHASNLVAQTQASHGSGNSRQPPLVLLGPLRRAHQSTTYTPSLRPAYLRLVGVFLLPGFNRFHRKSLALFSPVCVQ